ncbi:MAG: hypothetical protein KC561_19830, partial [Myxococcales bacterium]|nr:hypothetical protein [Myxococcales bacterium]
MTVVDPDPGETLTLTVAEGTPLPNWLTLDDNTGFSATLSGTPTNDDLGGTSLVFIATDSSGAEGTLEFVLNVINSNDPPQFDSEPSENAVEDSLYTYSIEVSDPDPNETLTVQAAQGLPLPGWLHLSFSVETGWVLSGTPTNDDVGDNEVALVVRDAAGATSTQIFHIAVANTNDPPKFDSSPVASIDEDAAYLYEIVASDVDAGDVLTIESSALPDWLEFSDNGGGSATLSGTPENDDVGPVSVTLTVSDLADATATQSFVITVQNTNDSPVFESEPVTSAQEDSEYEYVLSFSDPDVGDSASYLSSNLPAWLSIELNGGTYSLAGTPENDDVGPHSVSVTIEDENGAQTTQSFTVTVENTNDAPVFNSEPVTDATEDSPYQYDIVASDVDLGDSISIESGSLPDWLELTDHSD